MSQYSIKAKTIARYLAIAKELVSEKYLLLYVLRGLGPQYNSFITNIKMGM